MRTSVTTKRKIHHAHRGIGVSSSIPTPHSDKG